MGGMEEEAPEAISPRLRSPPLGKIQNPVKPFLTRSRTILLYKEQSGLTAQWGPLRADEKPLLTRKSLGSILERF